MRSTSAFGRRALQGEGWKASRLSDVAAVAPSGTFDPRSGAAMPYVGMEHLLPGSPDIPEWGNSNETTSSKTRILPGDVLFGKLRPYLRKVAVADREGVCSTEIIVLRPRGGAVTPRFLYYLCASAEVLAHAVDLSAGTRMPRISPPGLLQAPVHVPPIREQRRIADLLESLDATIRQSHEALARARVTRRALLEDLHRTSLAAAVAVTPLRDLAAVVSGVSWAKSDERTGVAPEPVPALRVANMRETGVDITDLRYITPSREALRKAIRCPSVMLVRTNTVERVGNAQLVPAAAAGFVYSSFLILVTPFRADDAGLIVRFLQTPQMQAQMTGRASGSTAGLKNLPVTWLREVQIPMLDESVSAKLLAPISAIEGAITAAEGRYDSLERLRSAVSSALLSGAHRIPESYDRFLAEHAVVVLADAVSA